MPFFDDKLCWKGSSRSFVPDFAVFVLIQPVLSLRHIYWRVLPKSLTGDVTPISPSTPGNKAAILLLFTALRKLEIELFNENC